MHSIIERADALIAQYLSWVESLSPAETCLAYIASFVGMFALTIIVKMVYRAYYYETRVALPHKELLAIRKMFHESSNKTELKAALDEMAYYLQRHGKFLRMQITEEEYEKMLFENVKAMCLESFEFILEEFERGHGIAVTRNRETMERVA